MSDRKQNSPVPHMLAIMLALISTFFFSHCIIQCPPLLFRQIEFVWTDVAQYAEGFVWRITSSTKGDVPDLDLPYFIAHSLGIAASPPDMISALILLITLLYTMHFHSPAQPPIKAPYRFLPPPGMTSRTLYAYTLRNMWNTGQAVVFILAWSLPVLAIAGIRANGIGGKLGLGWIFTLITTILLLAVYGLILLGGLWNSPMRSGLWE
ncbi:hypothetical protein IAR50_006536 [Cryptococcus sp. DSM 104548]